MIINIKRKPVRCWRIVNKRNDKECAYDIEYEDKLLNKYKYNKSITLIAPIIKSNLGRINLLANKYVILAGNNIIFRDLMGAGVLSLIESINNIKSVDSAEFRSNSEKQIKRAMVKEVHSFNSTRIPRNIWQSLSNITFLNVCDGCYRRCIY